MTDKEYEFDLNKGEITSHDLTPDLKNSLISAKNSDPDAGRIVLRFAAEYLNKNHNVPKDLCLYLQECFKKIIDGTEANRAFNLTHKQGPRAETEYVYDGQITSAVTRDYYLARDVYERSKEINSTAQAIRDVAKQHHLSISSIEKKYYKNKQDVIEMIELQNEAHEQREYEFEITRQVSLELEKNDNNLSNAAEVIACINKVELSQVVKIYDEHHNDPYIAYLCSRNQ